MPIVPVYHDRSDPGLSAGPRLPAQGLGLPGALANPAALSQGMRGQREALSEQAGVMEQAARATGRVGASLAQAFQAVGEVGEKLGNFGLHLFDAAQTTKLNQAKAAATTELLVALSELEAEPDKQTALAGFEARAQEIGQKHGEGLLGRWAARFQDDYTVEATRGLVKARSAVLEQARDQALAALDARIDADLQAAYQFSRGSDERASRLRGVMDAVDHESAAGRLSYAKAQQLKDSIALKVDKNEAFEVLEQMPGKEAKAFFNDSARVAKELPRLTPELRIEFMKKAEAKETKEERENHQTLVDQAVTHLMGKYGDNAAAAAIDLMGQIQGKKHDAALAGLTPAAGREALAVLNAFEATRQQGEAQARAASDRKDASAFAKAFASGDSGQAMQVARAAAAGGNPHAVAWMEAIENRVRAGDSAQMKAQAAANWGDFVRLVRVGDAQDPRVRALGGDLTRASSAQLLAAPELGGFGLDPSRLDEAWRLVDEASRAARKGGTNYMAQAIKWAEGALKDDKQKVAEFTATLQRQMDGMKDKAGRPLDDYSPEVFDIGKQLLSSSGTGWGGGRRYEALEKERGQGGTGNLLDHPDWFDRANPAAPPDQAAKTRAQLMVEGLPYNAEGQALLKKSPEERARLAASWGLDFAPLVERYGMGDVALARQIITSDNQKLPAGQRYALTAGNVEKVLQRLRGNQ